MFADEREMLCASACLRPSTTSMLSDGYAGAPSMFGIACVRLGSNTGICIACVRCGSLNDPICCVRSIVPPNASTVRRGDGVFLSGFGAKFVPCLYLGENPQPN